MPAHLRSSQGQASVELVALLPLLVLVCGALWQAVVAGQALWLSGTAARAAARAHALGEDPERAATSALPGSLARGTSVRATDDGRVAVHIRVPAVVGGGRVGTVTATASMARQR